jgi:hypothetical protein
MCGPTLCVVDASWNSSGTLVESTWISNKSLLVQNVAVSVTHSEIVPRVAQKAVNFVTS